VTHETDQTQKIEPGDCWFLLLLLLLCACRSPPCDLAIMCAATVILPPSPPSEPTLLRLSIAHASFWPFNNNNIVNIVDEAKMLHVPLIRLLILGYQKQCHMSQATPFADVPKHASQKAEDCAKRRHFHPRLLFVLAHEAPSVQSHQQTLLS